MKSRWDYATKRPVPCHYQLLLVSTWVEQPFLLSTYWRQSAGPGLICRLGNVSGQVPMVISLGSMSALRDQRFRKFARRSSSLVVFQILAYFCWDEACRMVRSLVANEELQDKFSYSYLLRWNYFLILPSSLVLISFSRLSRGR